MPRQVNELETPDPYEIGAVSPVELRIGMEVDYWPAAPGYGIAPVRTRIDSIPWQLGCRTWVVKVQNISGGVSTQHVVPVPPEEQCCPRCESPGPGQCLNAEGRLVCSCKGCGELFG